MEWAVCIITTNAAPPNTHPMRRHRIDCLQKNRRLRVVVRRRPDLCATRHFDESSIEAPAHMLLPSSRIFGFFVGTVDQEPPGTLMPTPTCIRSEARDENQSPIHLSTQSCSLGTLLHRSNRFSTFVNLILICDSDGQPVTMDVNPSSRVLSMGSARLRTALPRKVGFHRREDSRKLLRGWSGRRDSNPRRPAWEYERQLYIKDMASTAANTDLWSFSNLQPLLH